MCNLKDAYVLFKDVSVIIEELHRVLKPGGMIISLDPMMTEPWTGWRGLYIGPYKRIGMGTTIQVLLFQVRQRVVVGLQSLWMMKDLELF